MNFFSIILILVLVLLLIIIYRNLIKLNKEKAEDEFFFRSELDNLKNEIGELTIKNKTLSVYQPIVDIQKTIDEMLHDAKEKSSSILLASESKNKELIDENNVLEETINQAMRKINSERRSIIEVAQQESQDKMRTALNEANRILDEAKNEAQLIAGDAWEAKNNASSYDNAIKAMKNIIEGYGNKYIVPTYSLLDDLAQEFSYTDAGKELLIARDRTKLLVEESLAATCDYVEINRSTTAIRFVIDAFNGKVDTILTRVKKDNYGILSKKIEDAFSTVNYLGSAFRNAKITPEFLRARLNELKWACIVTELKEQQREEQRVIKEHIREEERARREYEKAIRESEKEEALLKKLIEKAQIQISTAKEEQKLKYEKQLSDLMERLKIAEEKNQRAISMAQQTRAGHVYIISNIGSFGDNIFKIGMTRRLEPVDRITELSNASVPFSFDIHAMIYSEDAPSLELSLHKEFRDMQVNKVNSRKEFFKVNILDIKNKLDEMTINANWTMLAQAKQYNETLIIEEAIKRDSKLKEEWKKTQEINDDRLILEENDND